MRVYHILVESCRNIENDVLNIQFIRGCFRERPAKMSKDEDMLNLFHQLFHFLFRPSSRTFHLEILHRLAPIHACKRKEGKKKGSHVGRQSDTNLIPIF